MKKILMIVMLLALAAALCACSSEKASTDPLVAKWVRLFDEGNSKALFSVEEIGDLDVTIWRTGSESGELEQVEDYAGSYTADKDAHTITLTLDDGSYVFGYTLVEGESLTLSYEGSDYVFDHVGSNSAAD